MAFKISKENQLIFEDVKKIAWNLFIFSIPWICGFLTSLSTEYQSIRVLSVIVPMVVTALMDTYKKYKGETKHPVIK